MTTRRSFLKALGVGAAVASAPALIGDKIKLPPGKIINVLDKPTYPREIVAVEDDTYSPPNLRFVVGHGSRLRVGDMIFNRRTRESVLVTGIRNDEILCVRGIQSVECPVFMGDRFLIVSSAYEGAL